MDNITQRQIVDMIDANLRRPIEYGVFDCALWSADVLYIQVAIDLAKEYRGKYSTLEEGMALLTAQGYKDHIEVMEKCDWLIEKSVAMAHTGDIGVVEAPLGLATGPIVGGLIYPVTLKGMGILRKSKAIRAFGVKDVQEV